MVNRKHVGVFVMSRAGEDESAYMQVCHWGGAVFMSSANYLFMSYISGNGKYFIYLFAG
jgi:hypothetical protein